MSDFLSFGLRAMNVAYVDRNGWRSSDTNQRLLVNRCVRGTACLQMGNSVEYFTTHAHPLCDKRVGRSAVAACSVTKVTLTNSETEAPLSTIKRTKEFEQLESKEDR